MTLDQMLNRAKRRALIGAWSLAAVGAISIIPAIQDPPRDVVFAIVEGESP